MFDKVIGPNGLLSNKTRVLVTHKVSILPETDEIIVIKEGTIAERGSFEELIKKKGEFAEFIAEHLAEQMEESDDLSELESVAESIKPMLVERSISRQKSDTITSQDTTKSITERKKSFDKSSLSKGKSKMNKNKKDAGKLIEKESEETGSVKLNVYKKYIKIFGWPVMLLIFIGFSLSNVLSFLANLWLEQWSNDAYDLSKLNDTSNKIYRITVYGALGTGEVGILIIANVIMILATIKASKILHNNMLVRILHSPMSFFGKKI